MIYIINSDIKLSTLYDHYKDTISYLKKDLEQRDKITIIVLILFIIFSIVEIKPIDSIQVTNYLIKSKAGFSFDINYNLLITAILIFILWTTIRYFQLSMNIEKQYSYIHELEDKLNCILGDKLITREGYSYLKEYPLLTALIHRVYNFFLPLGIIISMSLKIYNILKNGLTFLYIVNFIIGILVIICTCLYMLFIYRDKAFILKVNEVVKKIFMIIHLYKED